MKYRAYRRHTKRIKDRHFSMLASFSGYPTPSEKIKVFPSGKRDYSDGEDYTYVKRIYRGKASKYLKRLYHRKFRRGKNKLEIYRGAHYKRVSGDFWWDFC